MIGAFRPAFRFGTSIEEVVVVLKDARKLIEKGWTRGQNVRYGGTKKARYCLLGAIEEASADAHEWNAEWSKYYDTLESLRPTVARHNVIGVVDYNDEIAKSKKDVLKFIDEAVAELEGLAITT